MIADPLHIQLSTLFDSDLVDYLKNHPTTKSSVFAPLQCLFQDYGLRNTARSSDILSPRLLSVREPREFAKMRDRVNLSCLCTVPCRLEKDERVCGMERVRRNFDLARSDSTSFFSVPATPWSQLATKWSRECKKRLGTPRVTDQRYADKAKSESRLLRRTLPFDTMRRNSFREYKVLKNKYRTKIHQMRLFS